MAHVHSQVNIASRLYLHNEKRYNYTTPKSFLEQIALYSKLLRMKFCELSKNIERLENGLDKLKKTADQVTTTHPSWIACGFPPPKIRYLLVFRSTIWKRNSQSKRSNWKRKMKLQMLSSK